MSVPKAWRKLTLAHYAAAVSTIAILISGGSLYIAKRSYDLSAVRDQRELTDKKPAIDVELRSVGLSNLSVTVSIINRADINITPLDVTVEHSFEAGSLYFSNEQQSVNRLSSSLSLTSMGVIPPKGKGIAKAILSGVTDRKFEQFHPGLKLEFTARVRLADQQDTIEQISIARLILPRSFEGPRVEPTPGMFLGVMELEEARRQRQIVFFIGILLGALVVLSLLLFRFRHRLGISRIQPGNETPQTDRRGSGRAADEVGDHVYCPPVAVDPAELPGK
jgi:hypothetical protein